MASAQVAKKQDLLAAGKRRLEEFRKQKAKGKKPVVPRQSHSPDPAATEKLGSDNGEARDYSAGHTGMTDGVADLSGFLVNNDEEHAISRDSGSEPASQVEFNFLHGNISSPDEHQKQLENQNVTPELENQSGSTYAQLTGRKTVAFETTSGERGHTVAISSSKPSLLQDDNSRVFHTYSYGDPKDVRSSEGVVTDLYHQNYVSDSVDPNRGFQTSTLEPGHDQHGMLAIENHLTYDTNDRRPSNPIGNSLEYGIQGTSDPISGGFNSNIGSSGNDISFPASAESYSKRSRPSFLDSLNVGRYFPRTGQSISENDSSTASKLPDRFVASSWSQNFAMFAPAEPLPTPVYSHGSDGSFGNGFREQKTFENVLENKLDFISQRQNEDFAALEQHIEDLTQEKFSLQRAMEASKALAESLATENSTLTENYNQQASFVNQLKAEMEKLQGEIKAQMVELEAFKAEYMNAQLECNAADERAKLLASEVISLEEKALRLRSSELKLERELENSNAEMASYKKKLSSLEKERRDLQQTIDALQEEKKLLQSKLRGASTSGISKDLNRSNPKKDASTSTNDLRDNSDQTSSETHRHVDTENLLSLLQDRSTGFEVVAPIISPDQVEMIQNINSLMSEIKSEKEELMQALINEVSTSAKLKELNKELSYKLEVQTQRLELLTAQSMASEVVPARQPTSSRIEQESIAYADEGDEVVERVLGWIMKLFPGGPAKRRSSL